MASAAPSTTDGAELPLPAQVAPGDWIALPVFGRVRVVDAVDCAAAVPDHRFGEVPAGASRVQEVLGRPCRVLDVHDDGGSLMAWRLGEGRGVRPNGAYVVVLEYPDDLPRDYYVRNCGNDARRSFHTGAAIGDAWEARYVDHHPESLRIPQSGAYRLWTALTFTGERARTRNDERLADIVAEGFDVVLAQYARRHHPNTAGLAATRLLLCEIPDEKALWARIPFPPAPLPRRRIFWREEMSDGAMAADGLCPGNGGLDWLEQKARTMKILAQNTFCKDLLEFGHNQHWDPDWRAGEPGARRAGRWMWATQGPARDVWSRIVPRVAEAYGLDILPYYEYGGAAGGDASSLGPQKRAEPLDPGNKPDRASRGANYTHIHWSEGKLRVDITDPDTLDELKYILDGTILRFRDEVARGAFAGAWFRPRPGQWAVGFGDATRRRFADEANGGRAVSREDLRRDPALYARYLDWWGGRRAAFLEALRAYLATNGVADACVIFDNDPSEGGPGLKGRPGLVTDDPAAWRTLLPGKPIVDINDSALVSNHLYLAGLKSPAATWGPWEWQHACPAGDPRRYAALTNVWLALPFHRLFSVNDPAVFDAYRNGNGTETIVRHYGLNEHMLADAGGGRIAGYAIADFERAGRACMMAEVNAMANGDPVNIGYLTGSNYTRGFPGPVVEFNRNFLALPALPSRRLPNACDDLEVTVRAIDCATGTYLAIVHTGWREKRDVRLRLPAGIADVADVDGHVLAVTDGILVLPHLLPWQLLTFRPPAR